MTNYIPVLATITTLSAAAAFFITLGYEMYEHKFSQKRFKGVNKRRNMLFAFAAVWWLLFTSLVVSITTHTYQPIQGNLNNVVRILPGNEQIEVKFARSGETVLIDKIEYVDEDSNRIERPVEDLANYDTRYIKIEARHNGRVAQLLAYPAKSYKATISVDRQQPRN